MAAIHSEPIKRDTPDAPNWLGAEDFSALGNRPVEIRDVRQRPPVGTQSIIIGIDADGVLDGSHSADFDIMLTSVRDAPAPWISVATGRLQSEIDMLAHAIRNAPIAATILCRLLRCTQGMPFDEALFCESTAYSTLLGGEEFRRWLNGRKAQPTPSIPAAPVAFARDGDHVTITLDDPDNRNAMSAAMRDALFEALCAVTDDPSHPRLTLRANGRCFSTGGSLFEFGLATDLAEAHVVRTLRNGARVLYALGARAQVVMEGAAIGSGLELAAAAAQRRATANSWFHLPEIAMGLIPGAGGTVTLPRAIGRHRTAWLALSGKRLRAHDALMLGLIHALDER